MDSSDNNSNYSSDSSDSVEMNSSGSTSSVAVEASSYTTETADSDDDAAPIVPYQFEPSTESLDNSSEESGEENDERLFSLAW